MSTVKGTSSHTSTKTKPQEKPKTNDAAKNRATGKTTSSSEATTHGKTERTTHADGDRTTISGEARERRDRRVTQLKVGLENAYGPGGIERRSGADRRKTEDPQAAQRRKTEDTLKVLDKYSDFTNGKDDITSKEDYGKIARGEKNGDFAKYLKEKNPKWDRDRIDDEVRSLQSSSQTFISDPKMFGAADIAKKGGDKDGKISSGDLVAARLKNDIGKDFAPKLSVGEINKLHEKSPGIGNQAITNKYHHQAQQLNELLGGDKDNFQASWPAYATHASNSAGAYIRGDGLPGSRISDDVAQGNRKVFGDIAPHFDSYIDTFSKNPKANFNDWASKQDFQKKPHLKDSFEFLNKAQNEKDPDKKQEYLLASNALAGYHEQKLLDGKIDESTAPVTGKGVERSVWQHFANEDPKLFMPSGKGKGDLAGVATDEKIKLKGGIPKELQNIKDPAVRRALQTALERPNQDVSSGQKLVDATGTKDWSKLDDRMRTIVGLMVAGQRDERLGEYALDYNLPGGPSFTDHLKAVGGSLLDKGKGLVSSLNPL